MAGRLIPKKTKVQTQFYKNYTLWDALLALAFIVLIALTVVSGIKIRWYLSAAWVVVFIILMINASPNTRLYQSLAHLARFFFGRRKFVRTKNFTANSIQAIMPYVGILEDGIIDYKDYYGSVLEIYPVQYYMLSEERQNAFINAVDNALKLLSTDQVAMIVKTERPMVLDGYIDNEDDKIAAMEKAKENKVMSALETQVREEIVQTRVNGLEACNVDTADRIMKDHYYFVTFGNNAEQLLQTMRQIGSTIEGGTNGSMTTKVMDSAEVAVFLKTTYTNDVDERDTKDLDREDFLQWIEPDTIQFGASSFTVNGKRRKIYSISEYPNSVRNAWGNAFFNIPDSTVVVKFSTVPQGEAESRIDKSLMEMESQLAKKQKASKEIEKNVHYESLQELMVSLKSGNETLLDTNIFISCADEQKKQVRTLLRRAGFRYNELFGLQKEAFINMNVSQFRHMKGYERGINSSSLAAVFPFISDAVQDEKGVYVGANTEPFFIDFFRRDKERVNSNMIILGKSGSGKSYATKGLLAHLAADNSRVFVLDPEKEYPTLAKNLGGKVVDVGSAKEGRINPFQIVTSLEDEGDSGQNVSFAAHLQFLEEFFKVILDGITKDALEVLNECVKELYNKMGIDENTNIEALKPQNFPIFQDLFEYVSKKHDKEKDSFMKNNLKIIRTYIAKFANGGRNSNLWNGYSTITADENFIVFQFQTLLSNKNNDIANAQMLLIMRWLENEVFKNKDYNEKYRTKRKVIVAIDEAHVFIDEKKPVALDFMFQLAKRIRKYEGMQIVISQNIKDFVGSPEIARKSTAIINASQFSMIFSLAPNDINDLVALYEKSGGINESEQDNIVSNPRGTCFFITGPYSRTNVEILYADNIRYLFEENRIDEDGNFIDGATFQDIVDERNRKKEEEMAAARALREAEEARRKEERAARLAAEAETESAEAEASEESETAEEEGAFEEPAEEEQTESEENEALEAEENEEPETEVAEELSEEPEKVAPKAAKKTTKPKTTTSKTQPKAKAVVKKPAAKKTTASAEKPKAAAATKKTVAKSAAKPKSSAQAKKPAKK